MLGARTDTIERLRARIAALEDRPPLALSGLKTGPQPADSGILGLLAAPAGLLQEVFVDDPRAAGAALGFVLGASRRLLSPKRPALVYLQLVAGAQELGVPYAAGFRNFGYEPDQIVIGRIGSVTELLWAMEESLSCRAVAAVIADVPGEEKTLDFTVSRRLNLRAVATGTTAFMLRYGLWREASAADLRWRIAPAPAGADPFDPDAPGPPRFSVALEKSRLGTAAQRLEDQSFALDWVDHGFVVIERGAAASPAAGRPAVPRSQSAKMGDRLHQAG